MERKNSIDLLRIICCLAVIGIHVISGPISNYSGTLEIDLVSTLEKVHVLLNWSVPVFFMITGYCILSKQEYTYRQCVKHVCKYIVILATVGFLFALLEEVFKNGIFNFSVVLTSARNVVSGNLWDHMWYLYAIIGIYLVLPVLHSFMSTEKNNRFILTGLLFFFTIVVPSIERSVTIGVKIPFGGYLFYVCLGGMVAKGDFGKRQAFCIVLSGIIAAIYILLSPSGDTFGYHSLAICLFAVSVFILFSGMQIKHSIIITAASQCTLGVYLLHPLFINVAVKVLKLDLLSNMPYMKLAALYLVICLVSFVAIFVFRKSLPCIWHLCFTHSSQDQ